MHTAREVPSRWLMRDRSISTRSYDHINDLTYSIVFTCYCYKPNSIVLSPQTSILINWPRTVLISISILDSHGPYQYINIVLLWAPILFQYRTHMVLNPSHLSSTTASIPFKELKSKSCSVHHITIKAWISIDMKIEHAFLVFN